MSEETAETSEPVAESEDTEVEDTGETREEEPESVEQQHDQLSDYASDLEAFIYANHPDIDIEAVLNDGIFTDRHGNKRFIPPASEEVKAEAPKRAKVQTSNQPRKPAPKKESKPKTYEERMAELRAIVVAP